MNENIMGKKIRISCKMKKKPKILVKVSSKFYENCFLFLYTFFHLQGSTNDYLFKCIYFLNDVLEALMYGMRCWKNSNMSVSFQMSEKSDSNQM